MADHLTLLRKTEEANVIDDDDLISDREFAVSIGRSTRTTSRWRKAGRGPKWVEHLGRIWYSRRARRDWLNNNERDPNGRGWR